MTKRRALTKSESNAARRLKSAFDANKKRLGLTQDKVAIELEMTQGAFSHYLNGQIPLNLEIIFKVCNLIDIDPNKIYPEKVSDIVAANSKIDRLYSKLTEKQRELVINYMEDMNKLNKLMKLKI